MHHAVHNALLLLGLVIQRGCCEIDHTVLHGDTMLTTTTTLFIRLLSVSASTAAPFLMRSVRLSASLRPSLLCESEQAECCSILFIVFLTVVVVVIPTCALLGGYAEELCFASLVVRGLRGLLMGLVCGCCHCGCGLLASMSCVGGVVSALSGLLIEIG
jgi:hypothetical protein